MSVYAKIKLFSLFFVVSCFAQDIPLSSDTVLYPPLDGMTQWASGSDSSRVGAVVTYSGIPCLSFGESGGVITPSDMPNITTMTYDGTASALVFGDQINVGEGTVCNLTINGVLTYPCQIGGGSTLYDVTGAGNHAIASGHTWSTIDGVSSHLIGVGFTYTNSVQIPAITEPSVQALTITDTAADLIAATGITSDMEIASASYDSGKQNVVENSDFADGDNGDWAFTGPGSTISVGEARIYSPAGSLTGIKQTVIEGAVGVAGTLRYTVVENNGGTLKMASPVRALTSTVGTHEIQYTLATSLLGINRSSGVTDIKLSEVSFTLAPGLSAPAAGSGEVTFAPAGLVSGWLAVDGTNTFNIAELQPDGSIESHNPLIGDGQLETGGAGLELALGAVIADPAGQMLDARDHLPITTSGGFVHNGADCSLVWAGGTNTYAELLLLYGADNIDGPVRNLFHYSDEPVTNTLNIYCDIFDGGWTHD